MAQLFFFVCTGGLLSNLVHLATCWILLWKLRQTPDYVLKSQSLLAPLQHLHAVSYVISVWNNANYRHPMAKSKLNAEKV